MRCGWVEFAPRLGGLLIGIFFGSDAVRTLGLVFDPDAQAFTVLACAVGEESWHGE
jgi:hypothetical protein